MKEITEGNGLMKRRESGIMIGRTNERNGSKEYGIKRVWDKGTGRPQMARD